MAYIEFDHVCKTYRMGEVEIRALDGTSFSIGKGELVCILGPSGAGKTTCLNVLGGMDRTTSGKVLIDGKEITGLGRLELTDYRRSDIGGGPDPARQPPFPGFRAMKYRDGISSIIFPAVLRNSDKDAIMR